MVRVLALNDDNHETSFTVEDGRRFYNSYEFITELLAKPHAEGYEVRGYAIIDEPKGVLAEYADEHIDSIFDFVANNFTCVIEGMDFDTAFNALWGSSDERWY